MGSPRFTPIQLQILLSLVIQYGKNNEMSNLDDIAKWVLMSETSIIVHRRSVSSIIKTKSLIFISLLLNSLKCMFSQLIQTFPLKT